MVLMPRHEFWRKQYRERRYARYLTQPELNQRISDIMVNMMLLTPEAKIGLLPVKADSEVWMVKFTHMLEEMTLRHGPYPNGFTKDILKDTMPDFTSELGRKASKALVEKGLKPGDFYIKYGKREHMQALHEKGTMRLQPASHFKLKDYNGAIQDDELSIVLSLILPREDIVQVVQNPQDVPTDLVEHAFDLSLNFPTDYWIYCLTTSLQSRLFVDFQADACVIIHNKEAFKKRLLAATSILNGKPQDGAVTYVDPLLPKTGKMFIPLTKHFKYAYQEEFRFSWVPKLPKKQLEPIDFSLGDMSNISSLIQL
ncbi:MAG TPA: hypothetical protein VHP58_04550 [Alphaproteobacteria bacterium]|nr:hypothetical protein [Alphaproteobacteria bacterium]